MPDHPPTFAAELVRVFTAGAVRLPEVASVYAGATATVHNSSWRSTLPFERGQVGTVELPELPEWVVEIAPDAQASYTVPAHTFGGGEADLGPVYPAWSALRDALQMVLHQTAEILTDAGVALTLVAVNYAASDEGAQSQMQAVVPVEVPEPVNVDAPHDTVTIPVPGDFPLPGGDVEILAAEVPTHG